MALSGPAGRRRLPQHSVWRGGGGNDIGREGGDKTAHLSQPGQEPLVTQAVRKEHLRIKTFDGAALAHGNLMPEVQGPVQT